MLSFCRVICWVILGVTLRLKPALQAACWVCWVISTRLDEMLDFLYVITYGGGRADLTQQTQRSASLQGNFCWVGSNLTQQLTQQRGGAVNHYEQK